VSDTAKTRRLQTQTWPRRVGARGMRTAFYQTERQCNGGRYSFLRYRRPLDAALGCWRVGADALDVEFIQRSSELRVPRAGCRRGPVDAENTGLVALKC
jgi:hypothetical protein